MVRDPAFQLLLEKVSTLEKQVEDLKRWKQHCTLAAAGWGGMLAACTIIGATVHSYWDLIKSVIIGQR